MGLKSEANCTSGVKRPTIFSDQPLDPAEIFCAKHWSRCREGMLNGANLINAGGLIFEM
jgi:hypothetical protein